MTDINISVKRLVSSCSSFKAQENGNSWSIFNIFRHLHVCVALNNVNGETMLISRKLNDPQLRSPIQFKFYLLRLLGQGKVLEMLSGSFYPFQSAVGVVVWRK